MFCSKCGKEIIGNEKFCANCGNMLSGDTNLSLNNNLSAEPPKVEVYRKSAFYGLLCDFKVYIDNNEVGRLGNGKKKEFSVTPGEHKIKVKINWWWDHSPEVAFTAKNNEYYKFQCNFTFGLIGTLVGWGNLKSLIKGGKVIELKAY